MDQPTDIASLPAVAIDLGGTGLRYARVLPDGRLEAAGRMDTPRDPGGIISRIQEIIDRLLETGPASAVGLAVTGTVVDGRVRSNNLGWDWEPVAERLDGRGHPVCVVNDMAAAAVAEHRYGAGQGVSNLVALTISTGIGAGMVFNGIPLRGAHSAAGDVGHMTLNHDGPLCGCGRRGCWELYASGSAHRRRIREAWQGGAWPMLDHEPSVEDITRMAEAGNRAAAALIREAARYLGQGIASLAKILDPEMVVFMGGFAVNTWHLLHEAIETELREHMLSCEMRIACTSLGDNAGLMGAAALARGA